MALPKRLQKIFEVPTPCRQNQDMLDEYQLETNECDKKNRVEYGDRLRRIAKMSSKHF